MSTLPTSTQLGNTSIVKYMDDGGTTTTETDCRQKKCLSDAKNSH